MKIFSKIKAFFRFRNLDAEMDVSAAEVKNGNVFLHPLDDNQHVYCIKSDAVDIIISPRENIREEDVEIIDLKKDKPGNDKDAPPPPTNDSSPSTPEPRPDRDTPDEKSNG